MRPRAVTVVLAIFAIAALTAFKPTSAPVTHIAIDGHGAGRVFQGIGALSAGASSRLLIDYPEPYRSQILDYLFKPHYGASLQHLKVEIGSDVNSTDGSEPSFARTRSEMSHPNFNRGYEWWLMEEAKTRNPNIILDSLAWGAPGWIGNGHYYSQDMADYEAKFIEGAQSHGLDMRYTGIWNETRYHADYIPMLAATLKRDHLSTKIVCCDLTGGEHRWKTVTDDMARDPAFRDAVGVIGVHAPDVMKPDPAAAAAMRTGKPLWASEDEFFYYSQTLPKKWSQFAESLAMIYNRNYIVDRITATEIWSPITSYYDNLPAPNSGLMLANTPWSGHYRVDPMIWVTAHTTQFASPGWRYIDSACGYLQGKGSFVTLRSPSGSDYSVMIETSQAEGPQRASFRITGGLSQGVVHVWETNAAKIFEHVADIVARHGAFTLTLDPQSVYSITTTTGQAKGDVVPPPDSPFPFPFTQNFDRVSFGRSPKYFSDQDGAFEVWPCKNRSGRCLAQVITHMPIPWGLTPDPFTMLGDASWTDYEVSSDVLAPAAGDVSLLGRIDSADFFAGHHARWPSGYVLTVAAGGKWQLLSAAYKGPTLTLAAGTVSFAANSWHRWSLRFDGSNVRALVDGRVIASVTDASHKAGMVGIGSGWNRAQFDNFRITR